MKQIIKIFFINSIIVFLLSMFYSIFFQRAEAASINTKNITPNTYAQLVQLAANADDEFFDFNAEEFVKNASLVHIGYGDWDGETYDHLKVGGLCYAVKNHFPCPWQETVSIIDILGDSEGTVVVYTKSSTGAKVTTTKYKDNKKAVKYAYLAGYYAMISVEKGETRSWKWKFMEGYATTL